jgi:quercetin dioxygenase-like cupin family protein
MPERNKHIIYLDNVQPDDVGDAEGFLGVDIRWMITDSTMVTNHSTLFHVIFPKGAYHGPHIHRTTDELLYIVRGKAFKIVGGLECNLVPGAAVYIPKNVVHWMINNGDEDVEVVGFYPDVPNYAESEQVLLDRDEWEKYGFPKLKK